MLVAFVAVLAVGVIGCHSAPTAPGALSSVATGAGATAIRFEEPSLSGSAYRLTDLTYDGAWLLTATNNQGSFTAPLDASTVFRQAQLNSWQPSDPFHPNDPYCEERAAAYNAAGSDSGLGDVARFEAIINVILTMVHPTDPFQPCSARIVVQSANLLPPTPIRVLSFQPIP